MSGRSVPTGWEEVRLDVLADLQLGKMLSQKARVAEGGQPYLRNINVRWNSIDLDDLLKMSFSERERDKYELLEGDVLICEGGEPGRAAVWRAPEAGIFFQKALHRVRSYGNGLHPGYLVFHLWRDALTGRLKEYFTGTTIDHLTQTSLREYKVFLPPAGEQHHIVDKIEELFSELDSGVEALDRAQTRLERYRASVLQAAVEGRLTEGWRAENPPEETGEELLERILDERRERWEEEYRAKYEAKGKKLPKGWKDRYKEPEGPDTSELPKLPEGWCWVTTDTVADLQLGKMLSAKARVPDGGIPYLRNANVRWNSVDLDDLLQMSFSEKEIEKYRLRKGDVLVCEGGEPGRAAVWESQRDGILFQKALHRVRPIGASLHPRYLVFHLWANALTGKIKKYFTGTTIDHFTQTSFREYLVALPPRAQQDQIVSEAERQLSLLDDLRTSARQAERRASTLRQAILKRAFEGRLVPQDPSDEPASTLLERIQAERDGSSQQALDV